MESIVPTQERGNEIKVFFQWIKRFFDCAQNDWGFWSRRKGCKCGGCATLIHPTDLIPFVIARRYDEAISTIQTNILPKQNGVVRTLHPTNLIWIPAFAGMTLVFVRFWVKLGMTGSFIPAQKRWNEEKILRHFARSVAELQNLVNNRQKHSIVPTQERGNEIKVFFQWTEKILRLRAGWQRFFRAIN